MNKKKSVKKTISTFEIIFLLAAALTVIACGVNYAIVKNQHVAVDRKTDKLSQETQQYDIETQSILVQIDRKINRFAVKSELRELGSIMRERPDYVVERVGAVERPIVHLGDLQQQFPNLVYTGTSTLDPRSAN